VVLRKMGKSSFNKFDKKMQQIRSTAGYDQKGFWTLIVTMVFAVVCLIHIETSRAKTQEAPQARAVTVERLPSSEAKRLGVDPRNN
jgi:hypothetical protein